MARELSVYLVDGMPALSTKKFARSVVGDMRRMGVKCKVVRFAEVGL